MGTFRQIQTGIWQDTYILNLNAHEKLIFFYIMSNPHSTQCGIFEISPKQMSFETDLHEEILSAGLKKFVEDRKIYIDKTSNEIMLISWMKHNKPDNPKCQRQIEKELLEIKSKKILELWTTHAEGIYEPKKTYVKKLQEEQEGEQEEKNINKKKKNIKKMEEEKEQEEKEKLDFEVKTASTKGEFSTLPTVDLPPQVEIINYLNHLAGTTILTDNFATLEKINVRLDEGFTIQDFIDVMDKKLLDWQDSAFLHNMNPFTLFGDHFETYLAEAHDISRPPPKPSGRDPSVFTNQSYKEVN